LNTIEYNTKMPTYNGSRMPV